VNYDYISIPTRIQAFQMTRERRVDNRDWPDWLNRAWNGNRNTEGTLQILRHLWMAKKLPGPGEPCDLEIITLEGAHRVTWDDWIIRGTRGELYPCKPDVFAVKYRAVGEQPSREAAQQET